MRVLRKIALFALLVGTLATPALAWNTQPFTPNGVFNVPNCRGVYVIERNGTPFYVGRSRNSIYERLRRHVNGDGSRKVAEILNSGATLTVDYLCGDSVEQMEAQLIDYLGTTQFGNLRRETDPADWDN